MVYLTKNKIPKTIEDFYNKYMYLVMTKEIIEEMNFDLKRMFEENYISVLMKVFVNKENGNITLKRVKMPVYSKKSKKILSTVDNRLQDIFNEVIKYYDITITEGLRDIETQKKYVAEGKSQTMNSKHLKGLAVDVAPYPIDYNNINRFCEIAGCIKTIAQQKNIKLQWGGDWKNFKDYPHWELIE